MTSDMLGDPAEEALEGLPSVRFWPLIRPMDGVASNSFVIAAGSLCLVIDPGADRDQTQRIFNLLETCRVDGAPPVLLLLTHCHRDHCLAITHWLENGPPFQIMAHEAGAAAFKGDQRETTLSFLYGEAPPVLDVAMPLSFSSPRAHCASCRLTDGLTMELTTDHLPLPSGLEFPRQILRLDTRTVLDIFHTPGHSPDSLCIRLGNLLFTGDILFADKPGVAGIPGWSQPCLIKSLDMLAEIIRNQGITRCFPGHGSPLPAEDALSLIASARKNTSRLGNLIRLDAERVDFLQACARTFIYEAGLLLSTLGGRLYLLAERLKNLEETALAEKLVGEIGLDRMEAFVGDFQSFSEAAPKNKLKMELPLKAVNIVGRIKRIFQQNSLPEGIAETLLLRVEWLLRDYVSIATGLDLREYLTKVDISDVFHQALATFAPLSWTLDEGGQAAENPADFAVFLARSLDFRLPLPRLEISGQASDSGFFGRTDPLRLKLLFIDVLEQLAIKKPTFIQVAFEKNGGHPETILAVGKNADYLFSPQKTAYYTAMMQLLGGNFAADEDDLGFRVRLGCSAC